MHHYIGRERVESLRQNMDATSGHSHHRGRQKQCTATTSTMPSATPVHVWKVAVEKRAIAEGPRTHAA